MSLKRKAGSDLVEKNIKRNSFFHAPFPRRAQEPAPASEAPNANTERMPSQNYGVLGVNCTELNTIIDLVMTDEGRDETVADETTTARAAGSQEIDPLEQLDRLCLQENIICTWKVHNASFNTTHWMAWVELKRRAQNGSIETRAFSTQLDQWGYSKITAKRELARAVCKFLDGKIAERSAHDDVLGLRDMQEWAQTRDRFQYPVIPMATRSNDEEKTFVIFPLATLEPNNPNSKGNTECIQNLSQLCEKHDIRQYWSDTRSGSTPYVWVIGLVLKKTCKDGAVVRFPTFSLRDSRAKSCKKEAKKELAEFVLSWLQPRTVQPDFSFQDTAVSQKFDQAADSLVSAMTSVTSGTELLEMSKSLMSQFYAKVLASYPSEELALERAKCFRKVITNAATEEFPSDAPEEQRGW